MIENETAKLEKVESRRFNSCLYPSWARRDSSASWTTGGSGVVALIGVSSLARGGEDSGARHCGPDDSPRPDVLSTDLSDLMERKQTFSCAQLRKVRSRTCLRDGIRNGRRPAVRRG